MMFYFFRLFAGRSPLKPSRWRRLFRSSVRILIPCSLAFLLVTFIYSMFFFQLNLSITSHSSDVIISLTSTPARFQYELPFTIHSLLSQRQLPKQIRIYLSPTSTITKEINVTIRHLRRSIQRLDSSQNLIELFDQLVQIRLEREDYGPATKFLPIIREFTGKSQVIMICDDDYYYHPYTVSTLDEYSKQFPNSIIGLRGWRIRPDLLWGVGGKYEMAYHIVESSYLSEVYRVGVLTANAAYLIRSSFFDAHIHLDFDEVSDDIRRVDDIWLNGQASKRNIARYVVPSCCAHIDVTRTHELENYLVRHQMDRFSANHHALQWFSDSWEKDLWYRFNGENAPIYRSWWLAIYREWISVILNFKFIFHFGFT